MEPLATAVRRAVLLTLFAAVVAAAWSWWREQTAPPTPAEPARWPPLPPRDHLGSEVPAGASPSPTSSTEPASAASATAVSATAAAWVAPGDDGSTPAGFPVKAKNSSGIYHVPGGRFHERTRPDRCYASADAAEADGYRQSKT